LFKNKPFLKPGFRIYLGWIKGYNYLKNLLKTYNKPLFEGAAEGIEYIKNL